MASERYEKALEMLGQIQGPEVAAAMKADLEGISPAFAEYAMSASYGDVYPRGVLTLQQRQLINVAMLSAMGGADPQLRRHLHGALHVGVTPEEIVETIIQVVAYCGAPRGSNAMRAVGQVFKERGITSPL